REDGDAEDEHDQGSPRAEPQSPDPCAHAPRRCFPDRRRRALDHSNPSLSLDWVAKSRATTVARLAFPGSSSTTLPLWNVKIRSETRGRSWRSDEMKRIVIPDAASSRIRP